MSKVRVVIPDSHGSQIDWKAARSCVSDIKSLDPDEVVFLGDHIDAGGTFNTHQRSYTEELEESYAGDVRCANSFLDQVQAMAPRASFYYLFGNHEQHVERWAARTFLNKHDADMALDRFGPAQALDLKGRGIEFYDQKMCHMDLSVPGTIRLGRCYFTHGITAGKHAAATHLARFGANVVFGHVHRSMAVIEKTVASECIGAWCPGTLAKLQPLYMHTSPAAWTHGYSIQWVAKSGLFQHVNVSIVNGRSLLAESGLLRAA